MIKVKITPEKMAKHEYTVTDIGPGGKEHVTKHGTFGDLDKKYGEGHDMTHHGESKPHGDE